MSKKERVWMRSWPPEVPREFTVNEPLPQIFRQVAAAHKDQIAICYYGNDISYAELDELVDRFAAVLIDMGLERGDRVALYMQNCPQFVIAFFGTLRAGGVVVALNPMLKHTELEYELTDAGCRILVALDYLYPEVAKIKKKVHLECVILTSLRDYLPPEPIVVLPPEAKLPRQTHSQTFDFQQLLEKVRYQEINRVENIYDDLALLQYTGGTTGLPKGAMISHHALAYAVVGANHWFQNCDRDVFLGVTPFFHIMGMVQMMCAPVIAGGRLVVLSRFDPKAVAESAARFGVTAWVGATTMLVALLQLSEINPLDFKSFRYICTGGAPIGVELQNKIRRLIPNAIIMEGYGLTEVTSQGGAITPLNGYKPGFVGVPHISDIKIVDLERGEKELPANQEGEILIKGPANMKGYWQKPDETKKVIRKGWVHTGDVGLMDEEGYLKLLGRKKELIKCSGYSVFPAEVEDLLYRHPAICEVAVIGVPDPYRGESPKAFVVLKPEYVGRVSEAELLEWAKENMAAYKRPREVEFRKELPKSGAGKVLRRALIDEEWARAQE